MLDSPGGEPNGIRDRLARRVAVSDDGQAPQAQQVRPAVRVGVEALAEVTGGRPDQKPAHLPARRGADLVAHSLEERLDRPLEQLQADVAGEAVAHDDVGSGSQEVAALDVAGEAKIARRQQGMRLEGELVSL